MELDQGVVCHHMVENIIIFIHKEPSVFMLTIRKKQTNDTWHFMLTIDSLTLLYAGLWMKSR